MRSLLSMILLLATISTANAAVNLAVSQQSGANVREQADQLARQIGSGLGTTVNVVVLPDAAQVEAWLNRYATAELALVEASYAAGKPGQFVVIGPVGRDLTLIGRQGISGDLPQRIAGVLAGGSGRSTAVGSKVPAIAAKVVEQPRKAPAAVESFSPSKSTDEDRYFVSYVYRERLNRSPDAEHLEFWVQQLQSGAVTKQQLFEMACDLEKKSCGAK